jgi:hypothetical protein
VAYDGRLPNPRELALFRDDVLLVVLPAGAPGAATWGIPNMVAPPGAPSLPRIGESTPPSAPRTPGKDGTRPALPSRPEGEVPFAPN